MSAATVPAFSVRLEVFTGPFDLLLGLIARHRLDVTEVALSRVTDDFLAHFRSLDGAEELEQASEFLVVAATLLDLKTARLLPAGEVTDEEDVALLEARDLLFARLLQYRAYKSAAAQLAARLEVEGRRYPRAVSLEPRYAALLPEVLLGLGPDQLAELARAALRPRPRPTVGTEHLHAPLVSVPEQAAYILQRLGPAGATTFRALREGCTGPAEVVARFLAVLELYRQGRVSFEQVSPLGDLYVRRLPDPAEPGTVIDLTGAEAPAEAAR